MVVQGEKVETIHWKYFDENYQTLNPLQPLGLGDIFKKSPDWPLPWNKNKCSSCGIDWSGTMGYVCGNTVCPSKYTLTGSISSTTNEKNNN